MAGPLHGIRVLDLTQFLTGPFCTMLLADMGADVIKIETPGGEPQRNTMRVSDDDPESRSFLNLNRNKRGLVIDLRQGEGRKLLHELVAQSDVFVENFRPGVTTKLEIDEPRLRAIRPDLIYATITGFGDTGPWADRQGFDLIAQGMSGLMSVTGEPDGEPVKVGVPVTDLTSGIFAAFGIASALIGRAADGEGQRVSTSLFEAGLALAIHESGEYWGSGEVPQRLGSSHRLAAPFQALRAQDGYLTVGGGTEKLWERVCSVLGREELLTDERFATNGVRRQHRDELQAELEVTLMTAPAEEWVERLIAAGVPAGPILDYQQVLEAPHTHERGMVQEVDHPTAGKVKILGSPLTLSRVDSTSPRPAPLLGQHTDEILAEFGIDPARIEQLHADAVV